MSLIGQICEEIIAAEEKLLVDMEEKPHICEICNNIFSDKTSLEFHHLAHQTEKMQISEISNQGPLHQNSPEVRLDEKDEKSHVSDISMEEYFHENRFDEEKDKLDVPKMYNQVDKDISDISEICNKELTGITGPQLHHPVHRRKKPFVCEICQTEFVLERLLKRHLLSFHSKLSPEKCVKGSSDKDCPKFDHGFQKKPHLSGIANKNCKLDAPRKLQHLAQRKAKSYICEICKWPFVFKDHLKLHRFLFHLK